MNAQAQPDFFSDSNFDKWVRFHDQNRHVWELFEKRALEMIATGRKHYGARTIMEVARHDINLRTKSDDEFKINNNHIPYYARLFREVHPEYSEFFKIREAA